MPTTPDPATIPSIALADGHSIPALGLGVWQVANDEECVNAVRWALELGYRHIDTAQAYRNEESVGRAIRESGIPREEIFITTKFFPRLKDAAEEIEQSLERLGTDYVDLYLVHWPEGGPLWAWPGLEKAHEKGLARSIGVSNFSVEELDQLLPKASTAPVANQVQISPFEYRRELMAASEKRNIVIEAYSPLGTGRHIGDPRVGAIAESVERTPAQVLVRWALQKGTVVLPKSVHRNRIEENVRVFDFTLSDEQMAELDSLDSTGGTGTARENAWW